MSSDPAVPAKRSSWPVRWFPALWWALLAALYGLVQYWASIGMDSDKKVVATIALVNLAWLGPLAWALTCWKPITRLPSGKRWLVRLGAVALVVAGFASLDVDYDGDARWRAIRFAWSADPDERLANIEARNQTDSWQTTPNDFPRFLGSGYWAEVADIQLATDWEKSPPRELWKQEIGAGWSSFAIVGDYAVTQEQRGEDEMVVCYAVQDGSVVWTHSDPTRHDPASMGGGLGGVGPRATPTIHDGRIYTLGATGIVNCLDARSGQSIWTHNLSEDLGLAPLLWGNAGSPLIVPDTNLVVVNGGKASDLDGHSLLAFDRDSGELVWRGGPQTTSYASPVYAVLGGVPQIVQVNEATVGGYAVVDGTELWQFDQPGSSSGNASCSQPIPLANDRLLVSKGYGIGARLAKIVSSSDERLMAELLWEKKVLKTKLANVVIRDGYAYALDHTLLSCVEVETGKRQWKKRRRDSLGHGQVMLVGDYLFVLSETGEGVLLECNPDRYVELASMQMVTDDGITWNNPAISARFLLVRNNLEAACYELPELQASESDRAIAGQ